MLILNITDLRLRLSAQVGHQINQTEIAAATGIHTTLFGRYENNRVRRPDLDNIEKIYRYFKDRHLMIDGREVTVGDLFTVD